MLGNKKLVALCTSRVFDPQIHSFIEILNESLKAHGCNLWIYAINADLYWKEDADMSEATVFDILDWNRLDAVVLMDEKIKSHSVSEKIINKAHSLSMPVVVVDGEYDDTISISFDYAEGFEQIVRHVIEDHKAQRPHIMAGFKGNKFSDERIDVFKKVIEENGIAFSDDMVSYGEFWVRPARAAAEEILKREVLPDAVICANDIMAINVSDVFMNAGVGVPSDIIVTGFDGYDEALMSVPAITTASCKTNELAYMTAQAVLGCFIGDDTKRYRVIPRVIKNESCGCPRCSENSGSATKSFNAGFYRYHDDIRRQHTVSARMQSCNSPEELVEVLRDYYMPHVNIIIKNSCFESDRNFFLDDDDQSGFCFFYNSESNDNKIIPFDIDQSHPEFAQSAKNGYPWIFNALDYMNKTMGYICYSFQTYDITEYSKTAGISNMVSVGLGGYINMKYQHFLMSKVEEMYKIDALTGLYNRIAFHEAFKDMKNDPVMEGRPLSVIMVDLDRLKKINDTLGHDAGDR
nr:GGDEF domain-containing protein [Lachnospiraceae bacterium]